MYKKMNKLVRDNIPNIIEQKGDKPDFVILDSFDYYNELKKKLSEELTEFNESDDILELCDLVEVISAILDYKKIDGKEFAVGFIFLRTHFFKFFAVNFLII